MLKLIKYEQCFRKHHIEREQTRGGRPEKGQHHRLPVNNNHLYILVGCCFHIISFGHSLHVLVVCEGELGYQFLSSAKHDLTASALFHGSLLC